MNISAKNITAYVLAGGKSSRMGKDKGLMLLGQKKMVEYVAGQVRPCVDEVTLIAHDPSYRQLGYRVIGDRKKGLGPLGGIYTALADARTRLTFIVGCDMPFISTEAVKYVISCASDAEITIPVTGGRMQPLFGVYAKSCLEGIRENIRKKKLKMMSLITQFDYKLVPMEESGLEVQRLFNNINTPEEFELALKETKRWNLK